MKNISMFPIDSEISEKIGARTTEELISFRNKLRKMPDNPQAWAIRFQIVRELTFRYMMNPHQFLEMPEDLTEKGIELQYVTDPEL